MEDREGSYPFTQITVANDLTASFPEFWAANMQEIFYFKNIARQIASVRLEATLKRGDTVNRPYRSQTEIQPYTRGTDITIDDVTDTNEQLVINKEFATGKYFDNFDQLQSNYDEAALYAKDDGIFLSNQVDVDVFAEYANAQSSVDDGDLAGSSGNGIQVSTSNILDIFSTADRKLEELNIPDMDRYAVIDTKTAQALILYLAGKDTKLGDQVSQNGYMGRFLGYQVFRSNQLTAVAVLDLATDPTATDTIVINGVTFTFVSSIGTTAGNVLIDGTVDTTRASLATLINAPATTSATGVALSTANARKFARNVAATNDNSADTLTIVFKGAGGSFTVTSSLTDGTDGWDTAKSVKHNVFGAKGGISLVQQSMPKVLITQPPAKLGKNVLNGSLYGIKTYADGADKTVDVVIRQ